MFGSFLPQGEVIIIISIVIIGIIIVIIIVIIIIFASHLSVFGSFLAQGEVVPRTGEDFSPRDHPDPGPDAPPASSDLLGLFYFKTKISALKCEIIWCFHIQESM